MPELTLEQMKEFIASEMKKQKKSSKPTGKKKPVGENPKEPFTEPDPSIWVASHVFMRAGDTPQKVDYSIKHFRMDGGFGPSVVFFAHYHARGEECTEKCKERK